MDSKSSQIFYQFDDKESDEEFIELPSYYISPTYLLDHWKPVSDVIKKQNIKTVVMELHYDNDIGFIHSKNMHYFLNTPNTIIIGFNNIANTPFMIIKFIDMKHNEKKGIHLKSLSFLVITIQRIPYCGFEQFMSEINFIKGSEPNSYIKNNLRWVFNVDGGESIANYIVQLINGEFGHKKLC